MWEKFHISISIFKKIKLSQEFPIFFKITSIEEIVFRSLTILVLVLMMLHQKNKNKERKNIVSCWMSSHKLFLL
jgi:hypothetical protein